MPEQTHQSAESRPTRLALFANFFKGYMSASTIVAAAIPIPITSWKLIPIYSQQRGFLTVYASLFCFLLLAFVLMAIREYLQDLLHLDEVALLRGKARVADAPAEARVSTVAESPVSR